MINPMADLSRNPITRDLCGLRYLNARYVALGGGAMEIENSDRTLDVYATIFKRAAKEEREEITPENVAKLVALIRESGNT